MHTPARFSQSPVKAIAASPDCTLRTLSEKDIPQLLEQLDDPAMWHFLAYSFASKALTQQAVEDYVVALHQTPQFQAYAIATPSDDRCVGCVTAHFGMGVHERTVEYGGWVGRAHWRTGIARSATTIFTDWLFTEHQILRVFAAPYHANRAAIGTLQASGFTFEGRQRCSVIKNGQLMDQMLYAKLNPACADLPRGADRPVRKTAGTRRV